MAETKSNSSLIPGSIIIGALIIAVGIIVATSAPSNPQVDSPEDQIAQVNPPAPTPEPTKVEIAEDDHIRGNRDASVFIVEYSDLQCGFCQRFHGEMTSLLEQDTDVAWVYRHYPIPGHLQARPAAIATECAAAQGGDDAFWTYLDTLFENQNAFSGAFFLSTAEAQGLNIEEFTSCLEDPVIAAFVDAQYQSGNGHGVTGTPGSFAISEKGQQPIKGLLPVASLIEIVDSLR